MKNNENSVLQTLNCVAPSGGKIGMFSQRRPISLFHNWYYGRPIKNSQLTDFEKGMANEFSFSSILISFEKQL